MLQQIINYKWYNWREDSKANWRLSWGSFRTFPLLSSNLQTCLPMSMWSVSSPDPSKCESGIMSIECSLLFSSPFCLPSHSFSCLFVFYLFVYFYIPLRPSGSICQWMTNRTQPCSCLANPGLCEGRTGHLHIWLFSKESHHGFESPLLCGRNYFLFCFSWLDTSIEDQTGLLHFSLSA